MIKILRTKDLFVKTCKNCGLTFSTDKKRAYVCPSCQRKNAIDHMKSYRQEAKKEAEKELKPVSIPLMEMLRVIDNYNREHKTRYTYGQFCEAVESGKIRIVR